MGPQSTGAFSPTDPSAGEPMPTISAPGTRPASGMMLAPGEAAPAPGAVSRADAGSTGDDAELLPLLRSRMIFIGAAAVTQWAFFALGMARSLFGVPISAEDILTFSLGSAVTAVYALMLILILRDRRMPVPRLRAFELVAIALIIGLDVRDTLTSAAAATPEVMRADTVLPNAVLLAWIFHLVLYAVLIPNTARRSAIVVGTWVATATIVMLTTWSRLPLPPGQHIRWATTVLAFLIPTGGFAIFNSARINAYRREAASARKVGNYLLVRRLGGGGMGDVFLARHRLLKRPCAVKLIRPERANDPTFASRFEREVAATTRLNHPGAVQVYDYGRTDTAISTTSWNTCPGSRSTRSWRPTAPCRRPGSSTSSARSAGR